MHCPILDSSLQSWGGLVYFASRIKLVQLCLRFIGDLVCLIFNLVERLNQPVEPTLYLEADISVPCHEDPAMHAAIPFQPPATNAFIQQLIPEDNGIIVQDIK